MTSDEFYALLKRFAGRPFPSMLGRHVYVWQGPLSELTAKAPAGLFTTLDLHQLCQTLDATPNTDAAARQAIAAAVEAWLSRAFPRAERQQALAVTGCDLLMRYRVPLAAFTKLASESRLVVLAAPTADSRFSPPRPLPAYVHLRPAATLDYLRAHVADEAIVGE